MLPYKVVFTCGAGVLTLAFGMLPAIFEAPVLAAVAITVVFAAVCVLIADRLVHGSRLTRGWPYKVKVLATRFIAAGATVFVAAVLVLQLIGIRWWAVWVMGLAATVLVETGVAAALEYYWFRLQPKVKPEPETKPESPAGAVPSAGGTAVSHEVVRSAGSAVTVVERADLQLDHTQLLFKRALTEAGFGWLAQQGYKPIHDFGAKFQVQVPPERLALAGSDTSKASLPTSAAEPIAIALAHVMRMPLQSKWVNIRKEPAAGAYSISVVTQDVTGRLYPYEDCLEWASLRDPARVGFGLDTEPVFLPLRQHGQHIGQTRSGKSSLINTLIAYITRCRDAVLWVCGTEKLYDLVMGWLEVYLGTDFDLPFDWVANGPQDTVDMLCAAMSVARYRQSQPLSQRTAWPTVIVLMDEASFALRNKSVRGVYNGQSYYAAQMGAMIGQGAGSGEVFLHYATQRDTNDQLGDQGGDLQAQAGFTTAFRIKDLATIGRLMGDYKLEVPRHKGEFWLDDGDGNYPQLVKAPYIQEVDPTKDKLHSGLTLSDVAWARRNFVRRLDPGSAAAAGPKYAARHTRYTPAFQAYLTGAPCIAPVRAVGPSEPLKPAGPAAPAGPTEPLTGGAGGGLAVAVEASPEAVARLAQMAGVDLTKMSAAEQTGFATTVAEVEQQYGSFDAFLQSQTGTGAATPNPAPQYAPPQYTPQPAAKTRADRIVEIVAGAETQPVRRAVILAALRANGDPVTSEPSFQNGLAKLVDAGLLIKVDTGLYATPDRHDGRETA